jgi:hypothetical protein
VSEPNPKDLPHTRLTIVDVAGKTPPRVIIAPQGYMARSINPCRNARDPVV